MSKKIGLFGGTFDPIHLGHLNLAMELKENKQLDEVWFIPAYINPHKTLFPPASADQRLQMLELALQDFPDFLVNDLELRRGPPSFTVETVKIILNAEEQQAEPRQFFWLMGEDTLCHFHRWHQAEMIATLIPLLIGSRFSENPWSYNFDSPVIEEAVKQGWTKTRLMDISSTDLRQRLAQGLCCSHLIPTEVLHFIKQNHLYICSS